MDGQPVMSTASGAANAVGRSRSNKSGALADVAGAVGGQPGDLIAVDQPLGREPGAPELDGEAFCPSERLTTRIRNILGDYPAGVASLKEMLQNADDARARDFRVLYDRRSFAAGRLVSESLAPFQGLPAMVVFNDATFAEQDFQNLLNLGASSKRSDVGTVGKYGLGFNVVYHLADVITFVSGDRLVVFDPHGVHLPSGAVGRRYSLSEVRRSAPDMLAPFVRAAESLGISGFQEVADGLYFPGTLFRLPLRDQAQAEQSLLSRETFGVGFEGDRRAKALLAEFAAQAPQLILFLQAVEAVGIYEQAATEGAGTETVFVGGAAISGADGGVDAALRAARATVCRCRDELVTVQADAAQAPNQEAAWFHTVSFPLTVVCEPGGRRERWAMRGGLHRGLARLAVDLGQLAFAWVAVPLDELPIDGLLYCGLPLPGKTGLPFRANAPFALSSNRRDLWRASRLGDADHDGVIGKLARWNDGLLRLALPHLLVELLLDLRPAPSPQTVAMQSMATPEALYSMLPRPAAAATDFGAVAEAVLAHVIATNAPLFADAAAGDDSLGDGDAGAGGADGDGAFRPRHLGPHWHGVNDVALLLPSFLTRIERGDGVVAKLRRLRTPEHPGGLCCAAAPIDLMAALLAVDVRRNISGAEGNLGGRARARGAPHLPEESDEEKEQTPDEEDPSAASVGAALASRSRLQVLSRSSLCRALRPLAPPASSPPTSTAAAAVFSAEEASDLLLWLLEPVSGEEACYEDCLEDPGAAGGRTSLSPETLDGVPLVPLLPATSPAVGPAAPAGSAQASGQVCNRGSAEAALGVLRSCARPQEGNDDGDAARSALFLSSHPHIDVGRMLSGFGRLVLPTAGVAETLRAIASASSPRHRMNLRTLQPGHLAAGLVLYVVPKQWLGCCVVPSATADSVMAITQPASGSSSAVASASRRPQRGNDSSKAAVSASAARGANAGRAGGGGNQKSKGKNWQQARRDQRAHKASGDHQRSEFAVVDSGDEEGREGGAGGVGDADVAAAAAPKAATQTARSGDAGRVDARAEDIETVVGRLLIFWRFLDAFPFWHDAGGALDAWPLIATEAPSTELLPRRRALARRVLRGTDLDLNEAALLRSFGAPFLDPRLARASSRPAAWGCVPRREALASLSFAMLRAASVAAQAGAASPAPATAVDCEALRRWVRSFARAEEDADGAVAPLGMDPLDGEVVGSSLPLVKCLPPLPIFQTLAGEFVALGADPENRCFLGAPSPDGPFAEESPWEAELQGDGLSELGRRLLTYKGADARWVMKAAGVARVQHDAFLPLLRPPMLDELSHTGSLLYLRAVGQMRPWRHLGSAVHARVLESCRAAKLVVWGPDEVEHPRCCAKDCADPQDTAMRQIAAALAMEDGGDDSHLPFPPRAMCDDDDALAALRNAGLRNLSKPEAFVAMAERTAAAQCLEAGERLAEFLTTRSETLSKEWPRATWMHLRSIAFLPCMDCTSDAGGGGGTVPPRLRPGEPQRLADIFAGRSARQPPRGAKGLVAGGRHASGRGASSAAAAVAEDWNDVDAEDIDLVSEEEERGEDDGNDVAVQRRDDTAMELLLRAAALMRKAPLGGGPAGGGRVRLVAPQTLPGDFLHRWYTWEAAPFLPAMWARGVPGALRELLLPEPPMDRLLLHVRGLARRIAAARQEDRSMWRGPVLLALVVLREAYLEAASKIHSLPLIVLDDGQVCRPCELFLDLSRDLSGVRAVPSYLRGLHSLLVKLGGATASAEALTVDVYYPNEFEGPEVAASLLANAVNDPTFADVIFHLCVDDDETESGAPNGVEAYAHRLVIGRASEVFRHMVSGPLAVAAERSDGRLHITLPQFLRPATFSFILTHIYTGATDAAASTAGVVLTPPSFHSADFVCMVMRAADHFMLEHLKQWCEAYLAQPELLTLESIVDIITHADGCNAPQLFEVCLRQIGRLQDAVMQTPEWACLPQRLRDRILSELARGGKRFARSEAGGHGDRRRRK